MSFEIEWMLSVADDDSFEPATTGTSVRCTATSTRPTGSSAASGARCSSTSVRATSRSAASTAHRRTR